VGASYPAGQDGFAPDQHVGDQMWVEQRSRRASQLTNCPIGRGQRRNQLTVQPHVRRQRRRHERETTFQRPDHVTLLGFAKALSAHLTTSAGSDT
jgi:hypothetical protein